MALMTIQLFSNILRRPVPVNVAIYADKRCFPGMPIPPKGPYKTLYLLHGAYGDHTDWTTFTRVYEYAKEYSLCVVMPYGENKFYCDSDITGEPWGKFISEELVSTIEETFNVSRKREDRYIGGLSMGGFGAFVDAFRHPEVFSKVIAFSTATIKSQILNSPKAQEGLFTESQYRSMFGLKDVADYENSKDDYEYLARQLKDYPDKPEIYMACGTEDSLFEGNLTYKNLLVDLGFKVDWHADPGAHTFTFWNDHIKEAIAWLKLGESNPGVFSGNVAPIK